ncbi:MAG: hypothetical protein MI684_04070 [Chlorobiales bacterium]|nr:hypothetical protein [Chlorobiales bacterium]
MEGEQKQNDAVKTIVGVAMLVPSIGIPIFFASVAAKVFATIFGFAGSIVGSVLGSLGGAAQQQGTQKTAG